MLHEHHKNECLYIKSVSVKCDHDCTMYISCESFQNFKTFTSLSSNSKRHPLLKWAAFVKPAKNEKRAKRWVHLLARDDFAIGDIKIHTYLCEQHFPKDVDLNWQKNKDLEPFPANMKTLPKHRNPNRNQLLKPDIAPEMKKKIKKLANPWDLADLSVYNFYCCPDAKCTYRIQNR